MQDETKKTRKMSWDKGYYIALILCIAAIGISGYLFTSNLPTDTPAQDAPRGTTAASAAPSVQTILPTPRTDDALPAAASEPAETAAPSQQTTAAETLRTVCPVSGELLQGYSMDHLSYNGTTRDWRTHDGVDFACAIGTEVLAAADGVVDRVYQDDFLGTTVVLRHANGYVSCYANLDDSVAVSAGQSVKAGDVLGKVGATALLEIGDKPHLHFAVYDGERSVDPTAFLA